MYLIVTGKQMRISKLRERAEDKILLNLNLWEIEHNLKKGMYKGTQNLIYQEMNRMYEKKLKFQKQACATQCFMVTINTSIQDLSMYEDIQFLMKKVEKFVERKFVKGYIYNYEFYTSGENHFHTHILIYTAKSISISKLKECAQSTFKHNVDNPKDSRQIHVAPVADQKIQKKVDYISGIKVEKDKQENVLHDQQMRKMFGISDYETDEFDFGKLMEEITSLV